MFGFSRGEAVMIVMVVTHDAERRMKMCEYLQQLGYDTCVPAHRQEVVGELRDKKPDVVILDLYLAAPNALVNLRQIRSAGFAGKVVVLAGKSSGAVLAEAARLGVDYVVGDVRHVDGPFDAGPVAPAIKGAFHKEIARRAYELWMQGGQKKGYDREHWLEAEREIIKLEPPPHRPNTEA